MIPNRGNHRGPYFNCKCNLPACLLTFLILASAAGFIWMNAIIVNQVFYTTCYEQDKLTVDSGINGTYSVDGKCTFETSVGFTLPTHLHIYHTKDYSECIWQDTKFSKKRCYLKGDIAITGFFGVADLGLIILTIYWFYKNCHTHRVENENLVDGSSNIVNYAAM